MPVSDLSQLLRHLSPHLNEGTYAFATLAPGQQLALDDVVALVREPEGVSVVVDEQRAAALGLNASYRCAWITLTVQVLGSGLAFCPHDTSLMATALDSLMTAISPLSNPSSRALAVSATRSSN